MVEGLLTLLFYLPPNSFFCRGTLYVVCTKSGMKHWVQMMTSDEVEIWQLSSSFSFLLNLDNLVPKVGWEIFLQITWQLPYLLDHCVPFQTVNFHIGINNVYSGGKELTDFLTYLLLALQTTCT